MDHEGISVDITADAADFMSSIRGVNKALDFIPGLAQAAGASLVFAFGASTFQAAEDYAASLELARRSMGDASVTIGDLKRDIRDLGLTQAGAQYSASQLAQAYAGIAQNGRTRAELQQIAAAGAGLAAAMHSDDVRGYTLALNDSLTVLGLTADQASTFGDKMLAARDMAGVSFEQISGDLLTAYNKLRPFNMGIDETIATIAVLAEHKQDVTQFATSMGALADKGGAAEKSLYQLTGVRARDGQGNLRSLRDILDETTVTLSAHGKTSEQIAQILVSVFGERAGSALNVYRLNLDEITRTQNQVASSAGYTGDAVVAGVDAGVTKTSELKKAWDDLKESFGEAITPVIAPVLQFSADLFKGDLVKSMKDFFNSDVLKNLFIPGGSMLPDWNTLVGWLAWVANTAADIGKWFSDTGAMFSAFWNSIVTTAGTTLSGWSEKIGGIVDGWLGSFKTGWETVKTWASEAAGQFIDSMKNGFSGLADKVWEAMKGQLHSLSEKLGSWFSGAIGTSPTLTEQASRMAGGLARGVVGVDDALWGALSPQLHQVSANVGGFDAGGIAGSPSGGRSSSGGGNVTHIHIANLSLPNVRDGKSLIRDLEVEAQYGSLTHRRPDQ